MFIWVLMFFIIIGIAVVATIQIYNSLIAAIEAVKNNKRQIDIQLDRRYKVFESLITTVKQYMDYEKTTLKDVVTLRQHAQQAKAVGDTNAEMAAENAISHIATQLQVTFEQYPDLKANQNVLQLQEEIVSTENGLSYAKQAYNRSVEQYNAKKKSFPASLIVAFYASNLDCLFEYWSLTDEQVQTHEAYTIKF